MTNKDAIKWLENLKQDIGQLRHEDLWHYAQAIDEITELLEEQEEPHILTIEELWNAEVVWLEWRDKAQVKVALPFIDAQDETYLFNGTVGNFEEIPCWYKHTWVAWSARPTEEHRRKVKWE